MSRPVTRPRAGQSLRSVRRPAVSVPGTFCFCVIPLPLPFALALPDFSNSFSEGTYLFGRRGGLLTSLPLGSISPRPLFDCMSFIVGGIGSFTRILIDSIELDSASSETLRLLFTYYTNHIGSDSETQSCRPWVPFVSVI